MVQWQLDRQFEESLKPKNWRLTKKFELQTLAKFDSLKPKELPMAMSA